MKHGVSYGNAKTGFGNAGTYNDKPSEQQHRAEMIRHNEKKNDIYDGACENSWVIIIGDFYATASTKFFFIISELLNDKHCKKL